MCSDPSRNKFNYKDKNGNIKTDYNLYNIGQILGSSVKEKYNELGDILRERFEKQIRETKIEKEIKFCQNKIDTIDNLLFNIMQMSNGNIIDSKFQKEFIKLCREQSIIPTDIIPPEIIKEK